MAWMPVFIQLEGLHCLVVGGGRVAYRKASALLEDGAQVTAISPEFLPEWRALADAHPHRVALVAAPYSSRDVSAFALVFAAADEPEVNALVAADARRDRVWVNVADAPDLCTAQAAAVLRRDPLRIAVHTGGACPALSAALRAELEAAYPPWLGVYAAALARVRAELRVACADARQREAVLAHLADAGTRARFQGLKDAALYGALRDAAASALNRLKAEADPAQNPDIMEDS
mgnify:FL=1